MKPKELLTTWFTVDHVAVLNSILTKKNRVKQNDTEYTEEHETSIQSKLPCFNFFTLKVECVVKWTWSIQQYSQSNRGDCFGWVSKTVKTAELNECNTQPASFGENVFLWTVRPMKIHNVYSNFFSEYHKKKNSEASAALAIIHFYFVIKCAEVPLHGRSVNHPRNSLRCLTTNLPMRPHWPERVIWRASEISWPWPFLHRDVIVVVKLCENCQVAAKVFESNLHQAQFGKIPTPWRMNEELLIELRVHLKLLVALQTIFFGVFDKKSGYSKAIFLQRFTIRKVLEFLENFIG